MQRVPAKNIKTYVFLDKVIKAGGCIDLIKYCPHNEKSTCECRKPKPGLLLQAARELGFSPEEAFMVGDQITDIEAGKSAGCTTILVKTGHGNENIANKKNWKVWPDHIKEDILDAVKLIIELQKPYTG